jgi:hypothetical protein
MELQQWWWWWWPAGGTTPAGRPGLTDTARWELLSCLVIHQIQSSNYSAVRRKDCTHITPAAAACAKSTTTPPVANHPLSPLLPSGEAVVAPQPPLFCGRLLCSFPCVACGRVHYVPLSSLNRISIDLCPLRIPRTLHGTNNTVFVMHAP